MITKSLRNRLLLSSMVTGNLKIFLPICFCSRVILKPHFVYQYDNSHRKFFSVSLFSLYYTHPNSVTLMDLLSLFIADAVAQTGSGSSTQQFTSIAMMVGLFVIFYLLLIRPEQKRRKEHQSMVTGIPKKFSVRIIVLINEMRLQNNATAKTYRKKYF